jgi:hypothetical protein
MSINYDLILERNKIKEDIKNKLTFFEENKSDITIKRGFFIYGSSGIGKTTFVRNILNELNYDVIYYDSGSIRNKTVLSTIAKNNMSDKNVFSMFMKKPKKLVFVMDEIDSMTVGDKGGISYLIKLIRPKKNKKQKDEAITMSPVICIGNYHMNKKMKELVSVCNSYELKKPSVTHIENILHEQLDSYSYCYIPNIIEYIDGDLYKLETFIQMYNKNSDLVLENINSKILVSKKNNNFSKDITKHLCKYYHSIQDHNVNINETDRTTVSYLYHENLPDILDVNLSKNNYINLYYDILNNISISDYIDRITFQNQIWVLNEISSLIKIVSNNHIIYNFFKSEEDNKNNKNNEINENKLIKTNKSTKTTKKEIKNKNKYTLKKQERISYKCNISNVRFTKILTKYSTEYNNLLFLNSLCFKLNLDRKDLYNYLLYLRKEKTIQDIQELLEDYDIQKLDIQRIYTYIDKYTFLNESPE